jgi:hypothetical protein
MELTLKRKIEVNNAVIGQLFIDGKFVCYTLEDKIRDVKIKHETCIPPGKYPIVMTMSQRFKMVLPLLQNVPNFTSIRIHAGNTIEDTSGCPLVGTSVQGDKLLHSKVALTEILTRMKKAIKNKEKLTIEVINPEKAPPLKPKAQRKIESKVEPTKMDSVKVDTIVVEPVKLPEPTPVVTEQIKQPLLKLIIQWIRNNIFKN